jgi:hypothetical protein
VSWVFRFDIVDVREAGEAGGCGSEGSVVESPVAFGVNPEKKLRIQLDVNDTQ